MTPSTSSLPLDPRSFDDIARTVLDLFSQQVIDTPHAIAIVFEDRELTFADLDQLSNQFANAFHDAGVGQGDCVGLCIERCPEAVASMLGAFKTGAVFVPLDPEYPIDRIEFMLHDADIRTVVTIDRGSNPIAQRLDASPTGEHQNLTWIDAGTIEFMELSESYEPGRSKGSDLAYVMYTSGSTGQPKGVEIDHQALATYCLADIEVYRLNSEDRTLQFSTLNFDIAIEEILPPLLIGSAIVIRPQGRADAANELSKIINDYGVTAIHLATAYWHEWVDLMRATKDTVPQSLRLVIATGEKVCVEHFHRWKDLCDHDVLWCNAYGPTEATVTATVYIPDESFSQTQMPIGQPLPGYETFILDDNLREVGVNETGQLVIAGPALAQGYLNRPDLTDEAFAYVDLVDRGAVRVYKTGDLARKLACGNLEFAGRIDHQIKLGSYRIEPGEIETVLNRHSAVHESLVLFEQVENQKYLVAYVATGSSEVAIDELASHLSEHLPAYMVPPRYVLLSRFPKTINGKVDRHALPNASESKTATCASFTAPRTELEKKLAVAWRRALNIPQIGIYDDFFSLGGSSLLVTRVIAELTLEFEIEIPVRDFFANPTIASAAKQLGNLLGMKDDVGENQLTDQHRPVVHADFFTRGDRQLFSVRYQPGNSIVHEPRKHGILICNALGQEYTRAYRNLQQLANLLCQRGFNVLRFDYYGTGNSDGSCGSIRTESLKADLHRAKQYFRETAKLDRLSLLGIRLGATLAATTPLESVDRIVLWDPVLDGREYLELTDRLHRESLRSQIRYAKVVSPSEKDQAYGHAMNSEKRSSLRHLRLAETESWTDPNKLVILSKGRECQANEIRDLIPRAKVVQTSDEIFWDSPEYVESAFSSPDAFRIATEFLSE